jgi:Flp pilus assembly protein TadG
MFKRKRKRGQSIVEMSLIFPFFLLIVVGGIVDFGFAFYNMLALQQLVNDAASNAAEKNMSDAQINNYIAQYSSPPVSWHQAGIYQATISNVNMTDGSVMKRVDITYKSKTYTPFYQTALNAVNGNDYLTLRTQATYKVPNTVRNRENF